MGLAVIQNIISSSQYLSDNFPRDGLSRGNGAIRTDLKTAIATDTFVIIEIQPFQLR